MVEAADTGVVFWLLAAVILISGFLVVSLKNIFHCAIFLVICLTAVAGIFLLLEAEFLAAAQVLIYVGAVSILMIFAIMLTTRIAAHDVIQTNRHSIIAFFICTVFGLGTIALIAGTHVWRLAIEALPAENIVTIGKLLMTEFMLPFEVVSVLLLAAMIGAIVLARKESS